MSTVTVNDCQPMADVIEREWRVPFRRFVGAQEALHPLPDWLMEFDGRYASIAQEVTDFLYLYDDDPRVRLFQVENGYRFSMTRTLLARKDNHDLEFQVRVMRAVPIVKQPSRLVYKSLPVLLVGVIGYALVAQIDLVPWTEPDRVVTSVPPSDREVGKGTTDAGQREGTHLLQRMQVGTDQSTVVAETHGSEEQGPSPNLANGAGALDQKPGTTGRTDTTAADVSSKGGPAANQRAAATTPDSVVKTDRSMRPDNNASGGLLANGQLASAQSHRNTATSGLPASEPRTESNQDSQPTEQAHQSSTISTSIEIFVKNRSSIFSKRKQRNWFPALFNIQNDSAMSWLNILILTGVVP